MRVPSSLPIFLAARQLLLRCSTYGRPALMRNSRIKKQIRSDILAESIQKYHSLLSLLHGGEKSKAHHHCHCENAVTKQSRSQSQKIAALRAMTDGEVHAFDLLPLHSLPSIDLLQGQFAREGKFSRYEPGQRIETTRKRMKIEKLKLDI